MGRMRERVSDVVEEKRREKEDRRRCWEGKKETGMEVEGEQFQKAFGLAPSFKLY